MKRFFVAAALIAAVFSAPTPLLQFTADFLVNDQTSFGGMPGLPSSMPMPSGGGLPSTPALPSFAVPSFAAVAETLDQHPQLRVHSKILAAVYEEKRKNVEEAHRRFMSQQSTDMSFTVTMTGKFSYDFTNSRQRIDMNSIAMSGLINIPKISLTGDNFEILRYDIGKNFTNINAPANQRGTGGKCVCTDLQGEINTYYVPPGATSAGADTITINGASVSATKYTITLGGGGSIAGGGFSMPDISLSVWVDAAAPNYPRRCIISFKSSMMTTTITQDFWNVAPLPDAASAASQAIFSPTGCTCPAPVVIPSIPASAKVSCSGANPTVPQGCACLAAADKAQMPFCAAEVDYPVDPYLPVATTDSFVQGAYNMLNGATCSDKTFKHFLCNFYFKLCAPGKELYMPDSAPTCTAILEKSAANAYYNSGIKSTGSNSSSTSSIIASSAAMMIVAILALLF